MDIGGRHNWKLGEMEIKKIPQTPNLSTDADSSTAAKKILRGRGG